jgi:hypothetical protein
MGWPAPVFTGKKKEDIMLATGRTAVRLVKLASVLLAAAAAFSPGALAQADNVKLEWITWSFFRITSPAGKVIITNPFITGNPDAAAGIRLEEVGKPNLILLAA